MERSFRSRGVDVTIREEDDSVALELNGQPIEVAKIEGQYHSQTAHQFRTFDTIDEIVETLLRNEGRYWKLEGPPAPGGHHGGHGPAAGRPGARPEPGHGGHQ